MARRILFLYNGGTIGQVPEKRGENIILVPPKDSKVFQAACEPIIEKFSKDAEVVFEFITSKD